MRLWVVGGGTERENLRFVFIRVCGRLTGFW